MNIFADDAEEVMIFKDDPNGDRVMVDCEKCGDTCYEAKYLPRLKIISWKCYVCGHISKQENFEI